MKRENAKSDEKCQDRNVSLGSFEIDGADVLTHDGIRGIGEGDHVSHSNSDSDWP